MTVSFEISLTSEDALREAWGGDLSRAAKEALVIESYRTGKISSGKVAEILGLRTSIQGQAWLAGRGIDLNYDLAELAADRETVRGLFSRSMMLRLPAHPLVSRGAPTR